MLSYMNVQGYNGSTLDKRDCLQEPTCVQIWVPFLHIFVSKQATPGHGALADGPWYDEILKWKGCWSMCESWKAILQTAFCFK